MELYSYIKLFLYITDDYTKALNKQKKAQYDDHLSSTDTENLGRRQRKSRAGRSQSRMSSSENECSDSDTDDGLAYPNPQETLSQ